MLSLAGTDGSLQCFYVVGIPGGRVQSKTGFIPDTNWTTSSRLVRLFDPLALMMTYYTSSVSITVSQVDWSERFATNAY